MISPTDVWARGRVQLAAQIPEVRALVEAVDNLLTEAVEVNTHVEDVPIELWDQVEAKLAPFKEPQ